MENKPKNSNDQKYYMFALRIVGDFGATIAIPVVVLVLLGEFVEERYNFAPWGKAVGFILAALVSGTNIYKKAKRYGKEYQSLIK